MALAAFANHHALTLAAKQLCGQKKLAFFGFGMCRCALVLLHTLPDAAEQLLRYNGRDAAGDDHILIPVFANVLAVFEQSIEAAHAERFSLPRCKPPGIEILKNGSHGFSIGILRENLRRRRRGLRINNQLLRLLVQRVAQWDSAAVVLAFEGVFFLSAMDLLGQLSGVKLGISFQHGLQDDALRAFGDMFFGGNDFHTVLLKDVRLVGAVIAVSEKAAQLPDEDDLE